MPGSYLDIDNGVPYLVSSTGSATNIMPAGFSTVTVLGVSGGVAAGNGIAIGQTASEPVVWNYITNTATALSQPSSSGWDKVTASDGVHGVGQTHFNGTVMEDEYTWGCVWSGTQHSEQELGGGELEVAVVPVAVNGNSAVGYSYKDPAWNTNEMFPDQALYWPGQGMWTYADASWIDQNGNIFGIANGTFAGYTGEFAIEWSPAPEPAIVSMLAMITLGIPRSKRRCD